MQVTASITTLPILGICGHSGSGKTTLIEHILPRFSKKGLRIVVLKHIAHAIDADREGKDSARFFRAGVDVLLHGHEEGFFRVHAAENDSEQYPALLDLASHYDLILVEGHKTSPVHKVWLLREGEESVPAGIENIRAVLPWNIDRQSKMEDILDEYLREQWLKTPVFGCVHTGNTQQQPEEQARLEHTVERLAQVTDSVVITGNGRHAANKAGYPYLERVPGIQGSLAGILAAMRWAPTVSWLVVECDETPPAVESLQWLLSKQAPGVWGIMPETTATRSGEGLPVYFDFRCRALLENLASRGLDGFDEIRQYPKIVTPAIPPEFIKA